MARLRELDESMLDTEQRAVLEAIQSGPRGRTGLVGPFGVWVRAPSIGQASQALGAAVRYQTALAEDVKEVAICTVGAHHRAKFEFAAHGRLAEAAGVSAAAVEAIRVNGEPEFDAPVLATSHRIARALLADHRLDDAIYAEAVDAFGETGLIELVGIIGYYCMVSLTLNAFEVPLREGMADPFPDDPRSE